MANQEPFEMENYTTSLLKGYFGPLMTFWTTHLLLVKNRSRQKEAIYLKDIDILQNYLPTSTCL